MAALAASASAALAQSPPGDLKVTVYNDDMALISDTRSIALPAGRSRPEFPDVSARIRPEMVSLAGTGIGTVTSDHARPSAYEAEFQNEITEPDGPLEKKNGRQVWRVTIPANGTVTLRFN